MAEPRPGSIAAAAMQYAAVTERIALGAVRVEGAGTQVMVYSLATEAFREELGKVPVVGRVAILREQRLDEWGCVRALKTEPGVSNVVGALGGGEAEAGLAVEPVEGLQLLIKGQEGPIPAVGVGPKDGILKTPDMYMRKLIVGSRARREIDTGVPVSENIEAIARQQVRGVGGNRRGPGPGAARGLDRGGPRDRRADPHPAQGRSHPGDSRGPARGGAARRHRDRGCSGGHPGRGVHGIYGGKTQAKTWPTQRSQVDRLRESGLDHPENKLALGDLIRGEDDVVFAATGTTPGETLNGVRYFRGGGRTHTVVMSTEPRMVRFIDTIYALKPEAGMRGSRF